MALARHLLHDLLLLLLHLLVVPPLRRRSPVLHLGNPERRLLSARARALRGRIRVVRLGVPRGVGGGRARGRRTPRAAHLADLLVLLFLLLLLHAPSGGQPRPALQLEPALDDVLVALAHAARPRRTRSAGLGRRAAVKMKISVGRFLLNPATRSIERALRGGSPEDRSLGACVIIFRSRASATLPVITPCSRASDRVRHSPGRPRRGTPDAARSVYVRSTSQRDRSSPSIVDGRVAAGVGTERVKCTRFLRTGSNDSRRSSLAGNRSDHAPEPRVDGNERARCRADSSSAWGTSTASGVRSGAARSAISTSVRDAPGDFQSGHPARAAARGIRSLRGESPPPPPTRSRRVHAPPARR